MDGQAKTAEEIMGEIQKLCRMIGRGETPDAPMEKFSKQFVEQIAEQKQVDEKSSEHANLLQSIMGAMHSGISIHWQTLLSPRFSFTGRD